MSRNPRIRRIGTAVIGSMLGAVALVGCGAGQITQTSSQVAAVDGANATTGSIAVRDAKFEFGENIEGADVYPAGGTAPLTMTIVNTGADADTLLSVSAAVATSVEVTGDAEVPGGRVLLVDGEPVGPPSPPAGATGRNTPAPTTSAAVPTTGAEGGAETQIVLSGLRENIRAGLTYPVILTFERAGQIRVDVPVGNPAEPRTSE